VDSISLSPKLKPIEYNTMHAALGSSIVHIYRVKAMPPVLLAMCSSLPSAVWPSLLLVG
jgi:hypothetical protein